jgi:hypothetical protein
VVGRHQGDQAVPLGQTTVAPRAVVNDQAIYETDTIASSSRDAHRAIAGDSSWTPSLGVIETPSLTNARPNRSIARDDRTAQLPIGSTVLRVPAPSSTNARPNRSIARDDRTAQLPIGLMVSGTPAPKTSSSTNARPNRSIARDDRNGAVANRFDEAGALQNDRVSHSTAAPLHSHNHHSIATKAAQKTKKLKAKAPSATTASKRPREPPELNGLLMTSKLQQSPK